MESVNEKLNKMIESLIIENNELKLRINDLELEKSRNHVYSEFLVLLNENRALKDDLNREILEKNSIKQKLEVLMDSSRFWSVEISALQEKISCFPKDYHEMSSVIDGLQKENERIRNQFRSEFQSLEKHMYSLDFLDEFVNVNSSAMIGLEKIYLSDIFCRFIEKFEKILESELGPNWGKSTKVVNVNWIRDQQTEYLQTVIDFERAPSTKENIPNAQESTNYINMSFPNIYFMHRLLTFTGIPN